MEKFRALNKRIRMAAKQLSRPEKTDRKTNEKIKFGTDNGRKKEFFNL
jgi:hypothetical protein